MMIRKKSGEADGWTVATCLVTCMIFDDNGCGNGVEQGMEYYVQGDCDPVILDVGYKPEPETVEEEEE